MTPRPASPAKPSPGQPNPACKPFLFYLFYFLLARARFGLGTDRGVRVPEALLRSRRLRFCYASVFPQPLCRPPVSGLTVFGRLVFSCSSSFNLVSSSLSAPPYFLFPFFLLPAASSRRLLSPLPLEGEHITDSRVAAFFPPSISILILQAGFARLFLPAVTLARRAIIPISRCLQQRGPPAPST